MLLNDQEDESDAESSNGSVENGNEANYDALDGDSEGEERRLASDDDGNPPTTAIDDDLGVATEAGMSLPSYWLTAANYLLR